MDEYIIFGMTPIRTDVIIEQIGRPLVIRNVSPYMCAINITEHEAELLRGLKYTVFINPILSKWVPLER